MQGLAPGGAGHVVGVLHVVGGLAVVRRGDLGGGDLQQVARPGTHQHGPGHIVAVGVVAAPGIAGGDVAHLAGAVVAPAVEVAVPGQGQGGIAARVDRDDVGQVPGGASGGGGGALACAHLDGRRRGGAVGGGPGAELAVKVVAPGPDRAVPAHGHVVLIAGVDALDGAGAGDGGGHGVLGGLVGAGAAAAMVIEEGTAPDVDLAGGIQRQGVLVAGGDGSDVGQIAAVTGNALHLDGGKAVQGVALAAQLGAVAADDGVLAQLIDVVLAPGPDGAVGPEGHGEVFARGNIHYMIQVVVVSDGGRAPAHVDGDDDVAGIGGVLPLGIGHRLAAFMVGHVDAAGPIAAGVDFPVPLGCAGGGHGGGIVAQLAEAVVAPRPDSAVGVQGHGVVIAGRDGHDDRAVGLPHLGIAVGAGCGVVVVLVVGVGEVHQLGGGGPVGHHMGGAAPGPHIAPQIQGQGVGLGGGDGHDVVQILAGALHGALVQRLSAGAGAGGVAHQVAGLSVKGALGIEGVAARAVIVDLLLAPEDLHGEGVAVGIALAQLAGGAGAPGPDGAVGLQGQAVARAVGHGGGGDIGPAALLMGGVAGGVGRLGLGALLPAHIELEEHQIGLTALGVAELHRGMAHGPALGGEGGGPQDDLGSVGGGPGDEFIAHLDTDIAGRGQAGKGLLPVPVIEVEAGQVLLADGIQGDNDRLVVPDADDLGTGDDAGAVGPGGVADVEGGIVVVEQQHGMLHLAYPDGVDVGAVDIGVVYIIAAAVRHPGGGVLAQLPVGVLAPAPDGAVGLQGDGVPVLGRKGADLVDGPVVHRVHRQAGEHEGGQHYTAGRSLVAVGGSDAQLAVTVVTPGVELTLHIHGKAEILAGHDPHQFDVGGVDIGGGAEPVVRLGQGGIVEHPGGYGGAAHLGRVGAVAVVGPGAQLAIGVVAGGVDLGPGHGPLVLHPDQHQGVVQTGGDHVDVLHVAGAGGDQAGDGIGLVVLIDAALALEHEHGHAPVLLAAVAQLAVVVAAPAQHHAVGADGEGVILAGGDGGHTAQIVGVGSTLALEDLDGPGHAALALAGAHAHLEEVVPAPGPDGTAVGVPRRVHHLGALGQGQGVEGAGGDGGDKGLLSKGTVSLREADGHSVVVLIGGGGIVPVGGIGIAQLAVGVVAGGVDLAVPAQHDQVLLAGGDGHDIGEVPDLARLGGRDLHLGGHGAGDGGAVAQLALVVPAPGPDGTVGAEGGGELPAHGHAGGHGGRTGVALGHGDAQGAGVAGDMVGDPDEGGAVGVRGRRGDGGHVALHGHGGYGEVGGSPLEVLAVLLNVHRPHCQGAAVDHQVEAGEIGLHQGGVLRVVAVVHGGDLVGGDGDLGHRVGVRGVEGIAPGGVVLLVGDGDLVDGQGLGLHVAHLDGYGSQPGAGAACGILIDRGGAQLIVLVGAPGKDRAVGPHRQGVGVAGLQGRHALQAGLGAGVPGLALQDHGGLLHVVIFAADAADGGDGVGHQVGAGAGIPARAGLAAGVEAPGPGGLVLLHQHAVVLAQAHIADVGDGLSQLVGEQGGHIDVVPVALGHDVDLLTLHGEDVVLVAGGGLIVIVAAPEVHGAVGGDGGRGVGPGGDGDDVLQLGGAEDDVLHLVLPEQFAVLVLVLDHHGFAVTVHLGGAVLVLVLHHHRHLDGLGQGALDHLHRLIDGAVGAHGVPAADQGQQGLQLVLGGAHGGGNGRGGASPQQIFVLSGGDEGGADLVEAHRIDSAALDGHAVAQLAVSVAAPGVHLAGVGEEHIVGSTRRHLLHGAGDLLQVHFLHPAGGGDLPGVDLAVGGQADDPVAVAVHLVKGQVADLGGRGGIAPAPGPEVAALIDGQGVAVAGLHGGKDHLAAVGVFDDQVVGILVEAGLALLAGAHLALVVGAPEPQGAVLGQGRGVGGAGGDHDLGHLGGAVHKGHPELAPDDGGAAGIGHGDVNGHHAGLALIGGDQGHGRGVAPDPVHPIHRGDLIAVLHEHADAVVPGPEVDLGPIGQGDAVAVLIEVEAVGELETDLGGVYGQLLLQAQGQVVGNHVARAVGDVVAVSGHHVVLVAEDPDVGGLHRIGVAAAGLDGQVGGDKLALAQLAAGAKAHIEGGAVLVIEHAVVVAHGHAHNVGQDGQLPGVHRLVHEGGVDLDGLVAVDLGPVHVAEDGILAVGVAPAQLAVGVDAHHPHGALVLGVGAGDEAQVVAAGGQVIDVADPADGVCQQIGLGQAVPGPDGGIHQQVGGPVIGEDGGGAVLVAVIHPVAVEDTGAQHLVLAVDVPGGLVPGHQIQHLPQVAGEHRGAVVLAGLVLAPGHGVGHGEPGIGAQSGVLGAQLAVDVAAPGIDAAVVPHGQEVILPGGQLHHVPQVLIGGVSGAGGAALLGTGGAVARPDPDGGRSGAGAGAAVAQLSVAVGAPGVHKAVLVRRAGEGVPGGDGADVLQVELVVQLVGLGADEHLLGVGAISGAGAAVAQLPVAVVAPGPHEAVLVQGQGEAVAHGDGGDVLQGCAVHIHRDLNGRVPAGGAAVAQLATVVIAPGPDGAVAAQGDSEVDSRRDLRSGQLGLGGGGLALHLVGVLDDGHPEDGVLGGGLTGVLHQDVGGSVALLHGLDDPLAVLLGHLGHVGIGGGELQLVGGDAGQARLPQGAAGGGLALPRLAAVARSALGDSVHIGGGQLVPQQEAGGVLHGDEAGVDDQLLVVVDHGEGLLAQDVGGAVALFGQHPVEEGLRLLCLGGRHRHVLLGLEGAAVFLLDGQGVVQEQGVVVVGAHPEGVDPHGRVAVGRSALIDAVQVVVGVGQIAAQLAVCVVAPGVDGAVVAQGHGVVGAGDGHDHVLQIGKAGIGVVIVDIGEPSAAGGVVLPQLGEGVHVVHALALGQGTIGGAVDAGAVEMVAIGGHKSPAAVGGEVHGVLADGLPHLVGQDGQGDGVGACSQAQLAAAVQAPAQQVPAQVGDGAVPRRGHVLPQEGQGALIAHVHIHHAPEIGVALDRVGEACLLQVVGVGPDHHGSHLVVGGGFGLAGAQCAVGLAVAQLAVAVVAPLDQGAAGPDCGGGGITCGHHHHMVQLVPLGGAAHNAPDPDGTAAVGAGADAQLAVAVGAPGPDLTALGQGQPEVVAGGHPDHLLIAEGVGAQRHAHGAAAGAPLIDRAVLAHGEAAGSGIGRNVDDVGQRLAVPQDLGGIAAAGSAPGPDGAVGLQRHREVGGPGDLGRGDLGHPTGGPAVELLADGDHQPALGLGHGVVEADDGLAVIALGIGGDDHLAVGPLGHGGDPGVGGGVDEPVSGGLGQAGPALHRAAARGGVVHGHHVAAVHRRGGGGRAGETGHGGPLGALAQVQALLVEPQQALEVGGLALFQGDEEVALAHGLITLAADHDEGVRIHLTRPGGHTAAVHQQGAVVHLGAPGAVDVVAGGVELAVGGEEDAGHGGEVTVHHVVEPPAPAGGGRGPVPGGLGPGQGRALPGGIRQLALGIGAPDEDGVTLGHSAVVVAQGAEGDEVALAGGDPVQVEVVLYAAGGEDVAVLQSAGTVGHGVAGGLGDSLEVVGAQAAVDHVHHEALLPAQGGPGLAHADADHVAAVIVLADAQGVHEAGGLLPVGELISAQTAIVKAAVSGQGQNTALAHGDIHDPAQAVAELVDRPVAGSALVIVVVGPAAPVVRIVPCIDLAAAVQGVEVGPAARHVGLHHIAIAAADAHLDDAAQVGILCERIIPPTLTCPGAHLPHGAVLLQDHRAAVGRLHLDHICSHQVGHVHIGIVAVHVMIIAVVVPVALGGGTKDMHPPVAHLAVVVVAPGIQLAVGGEGVNGVVIPIGGAADLDLRHCDGLPVGEVAVDVGNMRGLVGGVVGNGGDHGDSEQALDLALVVPDDDDDLAAGVLLPVQHQPGHGGIAGGAGGGDGVGAVSVVCHVGGGHGVAVGVHKVVVDHGHQIGVHGLHGDSLPHGGHILHPVVAKVEAPVVTDEDGGQVDVQVLIRTHGDEPAQGVVDLPGGQGGMIGGGDAVLDDLLPVVAVIIALGVCGRGGVAHARDLAGVEAGLVQHQVVVVGDAHLDGGRGVSGAAIVAPAVVVVAAPGPDRAVGLDADGGVLAEGQVIDPVEPAAVDGVIVNTPVVVAVALAYPDTVDHRAVIVGRVVVVVVAGLVVVVLAPDVDHVGQGVDVSLVGGEDGAAAVSAGVELHHGDVLAVGILVCDVGRGIGHSLGHILGKAAVLALSVAEGEELAVLTPGQSVPVEGDGAGGGVHIGGKGGLGAGHLLGLLGLGDIGGDRPMRVAVQSGGTVFVGHHALVIFLTASGAGVSGHLCGHGPDMGVTAQTICTVAVVGADHLGILEHLAAGAGVGGGDALAALHPALDCQGVVVARVEGQNVGQVTGALLVAARHGIGVILLHGVLQVAIAGAQDLVALADAAVVLYIILLSAHHEDGAVLPQQVQGPMGGRGHDDVGDILIVLIAHGNTLRIRMAGAVARPQHGGGRAVSLQGAAVAVFSGVVPAPDIDLAGGLVHGGAEVAAGGDLADPAYGAAPHGGGGRTAAGGAVAQLAAAVVAHGPDAAVAAEDQGVVIAGGHCHGSAAEPGDLYRDTAPVVVPAAVVVILSPGTPAPDGAVGLQGDGEVQAAVHHGHCHSRALVIEGVGDLGDIDRHHEGVAGLGIADGDVGLADAGGADLDAGIGDLGHRHAGIAGQGHHVGLGPGGQCGARGSGVAETIGVVIVLVELVEGDDKVGLPLGGLGDQGVDLRLGHPLLHPLHGVVVDGCSHLEVVVVALLSPVNAAHMPAVELQLLAAEPVGPAHTVSQDNGIASGVVILAPAVVAHDVDLAVLPHDHRVGVAGGEGHGGPEVGVVLPGEGVVVVAGHHGTHGVDKAAGLVAVIEAQLAVVVAAPSVEIVVHRQGDDVIQAGVEVADLLFPAVLVQRGVELHGNHGGVVGIRPAHGAVGVAAPHVDRAVAHQGDAVLTSGVDTDHVPEEVGLGVVLARLDPDGGEPRGLGVVAQLAIGVVAPGEHGGVAAHRQGVAVAGPHPDHVDQLVLTLLAHNGVGGGVDHAVVDIAVSVPGPLAHNAGALLALVVEAPHPDLVDVEELAVDLYAATHRHGNAVAQGDVVDGAGLQAAAGADAADLGCLGAEHTQPVRVAPAVIGGVAGAVAELAVVVGAPDPHVAQVGQGHIGPVIGPDLDNVLVGAYILKADLGGVLNGGGAASEIELAPLPHGAVALEGHGGVLTGHHGGGGQRQLVIEVGGPDDDLVVAPVHIPVIPDGDDDTAVSDAGGHQVPAALVGVEDEVGDAGIGGGVPDLLGIGHLPLKGGGQHVESAAEGLDQVVFDDVQLLVVVDGHRPGHSGLPCGDGGLVGRVLLHVDMGLTDDQGIEVVDAGLGGHPSVRGGVIGALVVTVLTGKPDGTILLDHLHGHIARRDHQVLPDELALLLAAADDLHQRDGAALADGDGPGGVLGNSHGAGAHALGNAQLAGAVIAPGVEQGVVDDLVDHPVAIGRHGISHIPGVAQDLAHHGGGEVGAGADLPHALQVVPVLIPDPRGGVDHGIGLAETPSDLHTLARVPAARVIAGERDCSSGAAHLSVAGVIGPPAGGTVIGIGGRDDALVVRHLLGLHDGRIGIGVQHGLAVLIQLVDLDGLHHVVADQLHRGVGPTGTVDLRVAGDIDLAALGADIGSGHADAHLTEVVPAGGIDGHGIVVVLFDLLGRHHGLDQGVVHVGGDGHHVLHLAGGAARVVVHGHGHHHIAGGHNAQLAVAVAAPAPDGAVGEHGHGVVAGGRDGEHVLQIGGAAGTDALDHPAGGVAGGSGLIGGVIDGDQPLGVVVPRVALAQLAVLVVAEGPHVAVHVQQQGVVGAGGNGHDGGQLQRLVLRVVVVGNGGHIGLLLAAAQVLLQVGGVGHAGLPLPAGQVLDLRRGIPQVGHDGLIVSAGAGIDAQLAVGVVAPDVDGAVALQDHEVVLAHGNVHHVLVDAVPENLGGGAALLQLVAGVAVESVAPGPQSTVRLQGDGGILEGEDLGQGEPGLGGGDVALCLVVGGQHFHHKGADHGAVGGHGGHDDLAALAEAGVGQGGAAHPPLPPLLVDHQHTVVAGDKLEAAIGVLQGDIAGGGIVAQQVKSVIISQLGQIVDADIGVFVGVPGQGDPAVAAVLEIIAAGVVEGEAHHLGGPLTGIVGLFPPVRGGALGADGGQAQLAVAVVAPGQHMAVLQHDGVVVPAGGGDQDGLGQAAGGHGLAVHHDHMAVLVALADAQLVAAVVAPGQNGAVGQAHQGMGSAGIDGDDVVLCHAAAGYPAGIAGVVVRIGLALAVHQTQLALVVVAPGEDTLAQLAALILVGDNGHVLPAGGDGVDAVNDVEDGGIVHLIVATDHLHGAGAVHGALLAAAVAQLAVGVVAPGEEGAVDQQGHGVAVAGGHVRHIQQLALALEALDLDGGAHRDGVVLTQLAVLVGAGGPDRAVLLQGQDVVGAGGNADDVGEGHLAGYICSQHCTGGNHVVSAVVVVLIPDVAAVAPPDAVAPLGPAGQRVPLDPALVSGAGPDVPPVIIDQLEVVLAHAGAVLIHRAADGGVTVQGVIGAQAAAMAALAAGDGTGIVGIAGLPHHPLMDGKAATGRAWGRGLDHEAFNARSHDSAVKVIVQGIEEIADLIRILSQEGNISIDTILHNANVIFALGSAIGYRSRQFGGGRARLHLGLGPLSGAPDQAVLGAADGAGVGNVHPLAQIPGTVIVVVSGHIVDGQLALLQGGGQLCGGHTADIHSVLVPVVVLHALGHNACGVAHLLHVGVVHLFLGIGVDCSAVRRAHPIGQQLLGPVGQVFLEQLLLGGGVDQVGGDTGQGAHHDDLTVLGEQQAKAVAGGDCLDVCIGDGIALRVLLPGHHLNGIGAAGKGIVAQLGAAVITPGPDGAVRAQRHGVFGAHRDLRCGGVVVFVILLDLDPQHQAPARTRVVDLNEGLAITHMVGIGGPEGGQMPVVADLGEHLGVQGLEHQLGPVDLLDGNMLQQVKALFPNEGHGVQIKVELLVLHQHHHGRQVPQGGVGLGIAHGYDGLKGEITHHDGIVPVLIGIVAQLTIGVVAGGKDHAGVRDQQHMAAAQGEGGHALHIAVAAVVHDDHTVILGAGHGVVPVHGSAVGHGVLRTVGAVVAQLTVGVIAPGQYLHPVPLGGMTGHIVVVNLGKRAVEARADLLAALGHHQLGIVHIGKGRLLGSLAAVRLALGGLGLRPLGQGAHLANAALAPGVNAAVHPQGHSVLAARADVHSLVKIVVVGVVPVSLLALQHLDEGESIGVIGIAHLTLVVPAHAVDRAVGGQDGGKVGAGGHSHHFLHIAGAAGGSALGHLAGHPGARDLTVVVAKLTIGVVAPGVDDAAGAQSGGVIGASGDGDDPVLHVDGRDHSAAVLQLLLIFPDLGQGAQVGGYTGHVGDDHARPVRAALHGGVVAAAQLMEGIVAPAPHPAQVIHGQGEVVAGGDVGKAQGPDYTCSVSVGQVLQDPPGIGKALHSILQQIVGNAQLAVAVVAPSPHLAHGVQSQGVIAAGCDHGRS